MLDYWRYELNIAKAFNGNKSLLQMMCC